MIVAAETTVAERVVVLRRHEEIYQVFSIVPEASILNLFLHCKLADRKLEGREKADIEIGLSSNIRV